MLLCNMNFIVGQALETPPRLGSTASAAALAKGRPARPAIQSQLE
jgi:hypothetical protein